MAVFQSFFQQITTRVKVSKSAKIRNRYNQVRRVIMPHQIDLPQYFSYICANACILLNRSSLLLLFL